MSDVTDLSWGANCDVCDERMSAGRAALAASDVAAGDPLLCGACRDEARHAAERDALTARVKELEDRIDQADKALAMLETQGTGRLADGVIKDSHGRRWMHWDARAVEARRILRGEDDRDA